MFDHLLMTDQGPAMRFFGHAGLNDKLDFGRHSYKSSLNLDMDYPTPNPCLAQKYPNTHLNR